jgi:hypothetical protein
MPERELQARRELAHAKFAAGLRQLREGIEVAEGESNLVNQVHGQLAQERGVRAQQRLPRMATDFAGDRGDDELVEVRRHVRCSMLLHVQSV